MHACKFFFLSSLGDSDLKATDMYVCLEKTHQHNEGIHMLWHIPLVCAAM